MPVPTAQKIRFGAFELVRQTAELYKDGVKLKLQGQPIAVLSLLLERPGELVTREELRKHLWPEDTFVDFEHSLNTHIKKLRQVLDDDAETPRFIETLPRRGYRFIAQIEAVPYGGMTDAGPVNDADVSAGEAKTPDVGTEIAEPMPSPDPVPLPAPTLPRWKYALAAAALLAIAVATLYWWYRPRTLVVTGVHQLTRTGHPKGFSFGFQQVVTDGTRIYFPEGAVGVDSPLRIAQISTKGGEVTYLDLPSIHSPELAGGSSDGSELVVIDPKLGDLEGPVWFVAPASGSPRRLGRVTAALAALFPDGKRVLYAQASKLAPVLVADRETGNTHAILDPANGITSLSVSPDGQRIRFDMADRIWEVRADGSGLRRILPQLQGPLCCGAWSPDGKIYLFGRLDEGVVNLWAVSESAVWGQPRIAFPAQLTYGPISFGAPAVSRDGKQIFAIGKVRRGELTVYDKASGQYGPYLNGISAGYPVSSPGGQWVAYVSYPQNALWRSRPDGSDRLQLTFPPMGPVLNPKWSPDGKLIAFTEWGTSEKKIYVVPADGGDPMLLLSGDFNPTDPTWSPDSKSIAYSGVSFEDGTGTEVRILNLDTRQSKTIPGSQHMFSARWSPDGRYLAAQLEDFSKLFLYSFETGRWKELPSTGPGIVGWPSWSHDSRYLYAMSGSKVYRFQVPDGHPELVLDATSIEMTCPTFPGVAWYGLTPDDRIIVLRDRGSDELYALDLEYR